MRGGRQCVGKIRFGTRIFTMFAKRYHENTSSTRPPTLSAAVVFPLRRTTTPAQTYFRHALEDNRDAIKKHGFPYLREFDTGEISWKSEPRVSPGNFATISVHPIRKSATESVTPRLQQPRPPPRHLVNRDWSRNARTHRSRPCHLSGCDFPRPARRRMAVASVGRDYALHRTCGSFCIFGCAPKSLKLWKLRACRSR